MLTSFLPCADCLEIWELQPPGIVRIHSGLERDCFMLYLYLPCVILRYVTGNNECNSIRSDLDSDSRIEVLWAE